jgi:hypothetical protein
MHNPIRASRSGLYFSQLRETFRKAPTTLLAISFEGIFDVKTW